MQEIVNEYVHHKISNTELFVIADLQLLCKLVNDFLVCLIFHNKKFKYLMINLHHNFTSSI